MARTKATAQRKGSKRRKLADRAAQATKRCMDLKLGVDLLAVPPRLCAKIARFAQKVLGKRFGKIKMCPTAENGKIALTFKKRPMRIEHTNIAKELSNPATLPEMRCQNFKNLVGALCQKVVLAYGVKERCLVSMVSCGVADEHKTWIVEKCTPADFDKQADAQEHKFQQGLHLFAKFHCSSEVTNLKALLLFVKKQYVAIPRVLIRKTNSTSVIKLLLGF
jgi:hypothetical protein